ncbi:proteinase-activated receptor 1 [Danio rerio]|uniref:Proteinase-activated receptor 1 n=1 Tax=Danio rerio TaxID=7955 RepID=E7F2S6_DANRE|nr:proteinase-activated receptor 1-like [Danio rerio]|eukprot:XP_001339477.5 proteinase-activated receptor 1-like [Danio rerio]
MKKKTILFLILQAHICLFSNVGAEDATTDQPVYLTAHHEDPRTGPPGRSFAIKQVYVTNTYEPIDMEEALPNSNSSNSNKPTKEIVFLSYAIEKPEVSQSKKAHPCNDTDQKCNRTTIVEKFKISDDAVEFLKGPLVTRFMPSFYIFIVLISLPLNALALVTFTCRIREKKPAVIYMSHLACVDLLFALLLPLKIHYQLNASDWLFGEAACRVLTAAYYCYMYCSILLMMCMSVDRLLAVVFPVASLTWRNARKASLICALVWLLALAGTVPLLLMRQTFQIEDVGVTCHDALIHNNPKDQQYLYVFFILSCFYYFVPLIITIVSYSTIIYVLRAKSNRLSKSPSWLKKRRRAAIMLIAMLSEFMVCFAPINGILLYHCIRLAVGGNSGEGDSSYSAYMLAVCLGSASVFLDPLLYYYGSSQCRQKISSLFWWKKSKALLSKGSRSGSSFVSIEYTKASVKM